MKPIEAFYRECIDTKIAHCEIKASRLKKKSHCTQPQADLKRTQAFFFEEQKENLVQELVKSKVGRDLEKINAFLNQAFFSRFPGSPHEGGNGRTLHTASESIAENAGCYPKDKASLQKMVEPVQPAYPEWWDSVSVARFFELPWSDGSLLAEEE
jgi:hypothetical protein